MEISTQRQNDGRITEIKRKPIRIALTGKLRSGKDTFANYLVYQGFSHHKLSEGISDIVTTFLPEIAERKGKKREVYTTIGQTMRQLDPDVWIKYTWKHMPKHKNVVISDVRQKNEEEFLRSQGFTIVGIESYAKARYDRAMFDKDFKKSDLTHETENSVDDIVADYWVQNDGTIKQLYDRIDEVLRKMFLDKKLA